MNNYSFAECVIGKEESFDVEITSDMLEKFKDMSGDINPLHIERDYAIECGFEDKVVYGLCTASLFSKLVGVYIPGRRCLIQEVSYKFVTPVYVGDKLCVSGTVIERDDRSNQLFLKVRIRRVNDSALVVRGKMVVGVLEG